MAPTMLLLFYRYDYGRATYFLENRLGLPISRTSPLLTRDGVDGGFQHEAHFVNILARNLKKYKELRGYVVHSYWCDRSTRNCYVCIESGNGNEGDDIETA